MLLSRNNGIQEIVTGLHIFVLKLLDKSKICFYPLFIPACANSVAGLEYPSAGEKQIAENANCC